MPPTVCQARDKVAVSSEPSFACYGGQMTAIHLDAKAADLPGIALALCVMMMDVVGHGSHPCMATKSRTVMIFVPS